jgi:predicted pyridoxine 5'-phosphate oxidase superfamily flavin-nucleotide-binding protein
MSETTASPEPRRSADVGFHQGELAVQERAGTRQEAARLSPMLDPAELRGGIVAFLADRTFAAITARDADGRLWTSPLSGPPGFLEAVSPTTLAIHARLPAGDSLHDPLHGLPAGQLAGLVVVEFAARRRVRVNGTLMAVDDGTLVLEVEQAYGNCPQYIHQRVLAPNSTAPNSTGQHSTGQDSTGQGNPDDVRRAEVLSAADARLIRAADTFFLGTTNPERGSDTSHRGGTPGFVRVDGGRLWWPDYPGNNLFNSFGNLAVDPEASLLFLDFDAGRTLQLSGTAEVDWDAAGRPGDDGHTGRRAVFTLERLVAGHLLPSRQVAHTPYPRNPALTD